MKLCRRKLDALKNELLLESHDLGDRPDESYVLHMRVRGQAYDLRVALPKQATTTGIAQAFSVEHVQRLGRAPAEGSIEIVNWSATLTRRIARGPVAPAKAAASSDTPASIERDAYFGPNAGWLKTPVVRRERMSEGVIMAGPLLIEDAGSTIVVAPGQNARAKASGDLIIEGSSQQTQIKAR